MLFVCHPNGKRIKMALRETEDNAYAKFWGDKQSIMVCYGIFCSGQQQLVRVKAHRREKALLPADVLPLIHDFACVSRKHLTVYSKQRSDIGVGQIENT